MFNNLINKFIWFGMLFILPVLIISCSTDQGIVSPGVQSNQIPLAQFSGKVKAEIPVDPDRFNNLQSLHVVLTWHFYGYTKYTSTQNIAGVKADFPFNFTATLLQPPPAEVFESKEPTLGKIWMYCDINGNGKFDRVIHPELAKSDAQINQYKSYYYAAVKDLEELSNSSSARREVSDTFFLGTYGSLRRQIGDSSLTIWSGDKANPSLWNDALYCWVTSLSQLNKWEILFNARKREIDYRFEIDTLKSHGYRVRVFYKRLLFPKPGKELAFETAAQRAAIFLALTSLQMKQAYDEAILEENNWLEYPITRVTGEDFIIASSRDYMVLYLPDQKTVDELRNAEAESSFIVSGKNRIHTGYNLIYCDNQYRCKVCSNNDSIVLLLGYEREHFEPPSTKTIKPVATFTPQNAAFSSFQSILEGVYYLQSMKYLRLVSKPPFLWAIIDGQGTYRLSAADSVRYFSPLDTALQLEAVLDSNGTIEKIFLYEGVKKYVARKKTDGAVLDAARRKIDSLCNRTVVPITASCLDSLASTYEWDTLAIAVKASGDSLMVSIPGFQSTPFYPRSPVDFFSANSDLSLKFSANELGSITSVSLYQNGTWRNAPNKNYVPRTAAAITGHPAIGFNTSLSEHQGTGRDTWRSINGLPRYSTSKYQVDSLFLAPGDGCVFAINQSRPSDSISLHTDGDNILFKLPTMVFPGKKSLSVTVITDSASIGKRVRFFARGGKSPETCSEILCDDFWVTLTASGTPVTIDPIQVPAGNYYVSLGLKGTFSNYYCAFDNYRVGGE